MDIPMKAVALPHSDLSRAKPLLGFDCDGHLYHVLAFDFGDDGGAIGILREGDNFCARIALDALAQFNEQARDAAHAQQGGQS